MAIRDLSSRSGSEEGIVRFDLMFPLCKGAEWMLDSESSSESLSCEKRCQLFVFVSFISLPLHFTSVPLVCVRSLPLRVYIVATSLC